MKFVFILTSVLGLLFCNDLYSQTQSVVTPQMARKISAYCQLNDRAFILFMKSNEHIDINITHRTDIADRIIKELEKHLDYAENFIIGLYYNYGIEASYHALTSANFTIPEIDSAEAIWKKKVKESETAAGQKTELIQKEQQRQAEDEETTRRQREDEERQRQEAIDNRVSSAFGAVNSPDSRQGNGIIGSFNLSGRAIPSGGLPQPRCTNKDIQEEGRVVINITVTPNGNVIQAEVGQGTTISSIITRECALEAAERTKFNRIPGQNNQSGTITFIYKNDSSNAVGSAGTSGSRSYEGADGFGSFNISGRSIGSGGLPKPAYIGREEGSIVVNITVDPNGNVINAEIGRGTNIADTNMRKSALEAVKKAKFNRINGADNQSGTITYSYRIR